VDFIIFIFDNRRSPHMSSQPAVFPIIADGHVVKEDLPLPVVHYPPLFGTFLAFARDFRSAPVLCTCARPALENLLRLRPNLLMLADPGDVPGGFFPRAIARRLSHWQARGPFPVAYAPGVCHRCLGATPALPYGDETFSSQFCRSHGWYVNQAYLRLGILPQRHTYLAEVCPSTYQACIDATRELEEQFRDHLDRLLMQASHAQCSVPHDPAGSDLMADDVRRMMELRQRASIARRNLKSQIEALATQEVTDRYPSYAGL
jgi:hypothetical protein